MGLSNSQIESVFPHFTRFDTTPLSLFRPGRVTAFLACPEIAIVCLMVTGMQATTRSLRLRHDTDRLAHAVAGAECRSLAMWLALHNVLAAWLMS